MHSAVVDTGLPESAAGGGGGVMPTAVCKVHPAGRIVPCGGRLPTGSSGEASSATCSVRSSSATLGSESKGKRKPIGDPPGTSDIRPRRKVHRLLFHKAFSASHSSGSAKPVGFDKPRSSKVAR